MPLTLSMTIAGLTCAIAEWLAHRAMHGRSYATPIPRYIVGVVLALVPWSVALALQDSDTINAIVGIWYVFGCGCVGTFIGYEQDRPASTPNLDELADLITGEHRERE